MSDRALLVGIDHYKGKPLRGAVNDALRMHAALGRLFPAADIDVSIRPNDSATREGILERLRWLVSGATAGDRLFFFYSGHGMQQNTMDIVVDPDGKDETICPFDIDLDTGANAIRDKELHRIFSSVPAGVSFAWVSDSCCSADLTRSLGSDWTTKSLPPPPDTRPGAFARGLTRSAQEVHVALISACASDATADEGDFEQGRSGALTQALLEVLAEADALAVPLSEVVSRAAARLAARGLTQVPQIEGDPAITGRPLWTL